MGNKISECAVSGVPVLVTTHTDSDGIAAGAIVAKAAIRAGARCSVHALKEFDAKSAANLTKAAFNIVVDVGTGLSAELDAAVGENWAMIDHHQIGDSEIDNPRVFNAWKYDIDGGLEACSGSMAYLAAVGLDRRNADLAPVAVIAALGDRQDRGTQRSLVGKNAEIAEKAAELDMLEVGTDLLLAGRETRTIRDALVYTTRPFVEGLTWNPGACDELLAKSGIKTKKGGRYRVAAELDEDEKRTILEGVASFAVGADADAIASDLMGNAYTLTGEGLQSSLRDAREFAAVLNSCGRIKKPGIGVALCMGDRITIVNEAEEALQNYRETIQECMERISSERWRIEEKKAHVMINAEGVVSESMTGAISSMIAGAPSSAGKIIILRSGADGGRVKFSSRKSRGCDKSVNLSDIMRGAERFDGIGGGHESSAGARISKNKLNGFLDYIEENVSRVQGADSHS